MKKVVSVALAVTMMSVLTACGSSAPASTTAAPAAAAPAAAAPAAAAPAAGAKEIVVSHTYAADHNVSKAFEEFKTYMETETNGAITVNHQPNSAMGGDDEAMELCADGIVTLMVPSVASLESYSPDWSVLSLAYLFKSVDDANAAVDGEVGDYLKSTLDGSPFICLGFNSNGTRNMTNSVRPITCVEDMKGIKLRVMNNPTYVTWVNALGANATPMGFNEVFTALQQHTVDGQENGAANAYTAGFNEVQKYFSVTEHVFDMNAIICNRDFYEGLTDEERAIFDKGVKEILIDGQRATEVAEDADWIAKWGETCEVNYLTPEAKQGFMDALKDVYAESQKEHPKMWEMLEKYR